ncbi:ergothioneine biosynthesis protein EgtB [Thalassoglobus polymorphus]|uniref:Iron(II)-dependent oxidoreductase EgtB n=1 Tax=Thalassoglobus polymorphus TaxID=2527994 RepID=A0A517QJC1_9PLAN|nr:ergothioneine biosynthesis protein EgtB [Thalassoglobus polymorphus]QDT31685.1 Iron(II)-dependent oxidoreductase EgtB [Thalassoglobus polymorphus]
MSFLRMQETAHDQLIEHLLDVRTFSETITNSLEREDFVIQSMPDVSPAKWHLAHTTWFFETFVLEPSVPDYQLFHPQFRFLFNSYYNAVGDRHPRAHRGMLSRPTIDEVRKYRAYVDHALAKLNVEQLSDEVRSVIEIGIHHEQQHQELMLTDIKHVLNINPLRPAYRSDLTTPEPSEPQALSWSHFDSGIHQVGHAGDNFHFDNEAPRHEVLLRDFQLANRLTSNQEYLEFIEDRGYQRPELWLSEGWDAVQQLGWTCPLYWERVNDEWQTFTLAGMRDLHLQEPVTHVSFFEADAFARWKGCRLPTEFEWEHVAQIYQPGPQSNFVEEDLLHPRSAPTPDDQKSPAQLYGDAWEWTASPYIAYPGYHPPDGAIGEYNGKFMSSQWVLRGGSCVTSKSHIRPTYRNFFHPEKRWQFTGIRLAE